MRPVRPSIKSIIVPIKEGVYGTFKGFPDSKTGSKVDSVKFVFSNEGQIYLKYMEDCNELKIVISNNRYDIIDIDIPLEKLRGTDEVKCIMEAIIEERYLISTQCKMMMDDLEEDLEEDLEVEN